MKATFIIFTTILMIGTGCISSEIKRPAVVEEGARDGYQSYRNDEFGFSFMYPEDWVLTDFTNSATATLGSIVGVKTPDTDERIQNRQLSPDMEYNLVVSYWDDINNKYAQAGDGSESRYDYESLEE